MYNIKNIIYILTILECCEKAWIYTRKFKCASEFIDSNEQMELNAVISLFIAIGEESKKIDIELKESVDFELSWSDIAGLRDKISHNYRGIDADILWIIIHKDLQKLKTALLEMVSLLNIDKELLGEFMSTPHYKNLSYLIK